MIGKMKDGCQTKERRHSASCCAEIKTIKKKLFSKIEGFSCSENEKNFSNKHWLFETIAK